MEINAVLHRAGPLEEKFVSVFTTAKAYGQEHWF